MRPRDCYLLGLIGKLTLKNKNRSDVFSNKFGLKCSWKYLASYGARWWLGPCLRFVVLCHSPFPRLDPLNIASYGISEFTYLLMLLLHAPNGSFTLCWCALISTYYVTTSITGIKWWDNCTLTILCGKQFKTRFTHAVRATTLGFVTNITDFTYPGVFGDVYAHAARYLIIVIWNLAVRIKQTFVL